MFCSKCGAAIPENAKFCAKCGNPVQKSSIPVKEEKKEEKIDKTAESVPGPEALKEPPKPRSKKGITVLLIALILVLAGVIGFGGYYLTHRSGNAVDRTEELSSRTETDENGGERDHGTGEESKTDAGSESEISARPEVYTGERQNVNIEIRQVDNSRFPEITFYASITDENGVVPEGLDKTAFTVSEIDASGNVIDADIQDVYQVVNNSVSRTSINLVLDSSGSMDSSRKMEQAKNAANALLRQMDLAGGDQVEVITFDDYVYLEQDFTSRQDELESAINGIATGGMTALYDGLYAGLYQTYFEDGIKCVIGFTDGMENASSYSFDDVVNLAQNTGIPVFIIGIGEEYDADELQELAQLCSGKYYSANVTDLEQILEDIYVGIYQEQQDYYVFKYTTTNTDNVGSFREIVLETSETTEFFGTYTKEYVPQSDITGAFSSSYMSQDYVLDFSSQREVTEADLEGLSLAELRIARNEIFARHGRQFRDSMLNQWFYSKVWYLNLPAKYSPGDFDAISPSPLSILEQNNTQFILAYEQQMMNTRDIYPNAATVLLSDYDLALSKAVLKTALAQVESYPETDIRNQNIQRIQEAIDKDDVAY